MPALGGVATNYTLSSGPLPVTKAVTIAGGGAGQVEISGDDASTVFTVTAGPTTISGLTISHGAGGDATSDGGGITATADLTLRDDVFSRTTSGGSGAYDGAPEAGGAGGVQSNAGTLTVRDSTFHDDAGGDGAIGPDDGDQQGGNGGPGAIAARSASVVNVTVTASTGGDGGAGSDGTDEDDVGEPFTPPGYGGNGGAGAISGPIVLTGGVVVQSSTLAGNFAGEGGAPGGGGDNDDGGPTLPGDPGGSAVVGVLLQTSIAISSQSVRTTCVFTRDGGHNLTFPSGNDCPGAVFADPLLAGLAANGGATPTLAIAANSPAIDAAPTSACPATDQRGVARPQGSACDIGAFEHDPVTHGGGGTDPGGGPDPGGGSNPGRRPADPRRLEPRWHLHPGRRHATDERRPARRRQPAKRPQGPADKAPRAVVDAPTVPAIRDAAFARPPAPALGHGHSDARARLVVGASRLPVDRAVAPQRTARGTRHPPPRRGSRAAVARRLPAPDSGRLRADAARVGLERHGHVLGPQAALSQRGASSVTTRSTNAS